MANVVTQIISGENNSKVGFKLKPASARRLNCQMPQIPVVTPELLKTFSNERSSKNKMN
jgi:hypothetical protein